MDRPIKVLHVMVGDGNYNGIASFLYNYYSHIDHNKVHFDFLYCCKNSMKAVEDSPVLRDSTITTLGMLEKRNNGIRGWIRLIRTLLHFFDEQFYDIVHVDTSILQINVCVAYALRGRSALILHSHNTKSIVDYRTGVKYHIKNMFHPVFRAYINRKANACFACSRAAGIDLFGRKGIESSKFKVINNAIDVEKYSFNPEVRKRLREEYGIGNRLLLGFVGRLSTQKNPRFIVDVFSEIHKRNSETELWMVGDGELRVQVEKEIEELGISDSVKLLGIRQDVNDLMQAMDAFIFPSLWEGLGISVIEAQASGLSVYSSDRVPIETKITPLIHYISLNYPAERWAEMIVEDMRSNSDRVIMDNYIKKAGFDIRNEAESLMEIYQEMSKIPQNNKLRIEDDFT